MLEKSFKKGYKYDAGYDIVITDHMSFPPKKVTIYELDNVITPKKGTCVMLVARTSAAKQGLIISMCPVDADYTGKLTAIVFNASSKTVEYGPGESFCQAIFVKLAKCTIPKSQYYIKKKGKRGENKFGSTGR